MSGKKTQFGIDGAYSYQIIDNNTGNFIADVPEQSNLILDAYLDLVTPIPKGALYLCLGAGVVTPPANSDTDLGNQIKTQYMGAFNVSAYEDNPDHFLIRFSSVTDFTDIENNGISELGIRRSSSTGPLITRALIKDSSGNPATISVNAGQTLRLTYSLYCKIPKTIFSGSILTPHGLLEYEYSIGDQTVAQVIMESFVKNSEYGGVNVGQAFEVYFGNGTSSSHYGTRSFDIPNRKVVSTFKIAAATTNRVLGAPVSTTWTDSLLFKMARYNDPFHFRVPKGAAKITLPANYDLEVSVEITWGRLP